MRQYLLPIAAFALFFSPLEIAPNVADTIHQIERQIDPDFKQYMRSMSVQISHSNNGGSGVIIGKRNDTYLVLTNNHVIRTKDEITLQTADSVKHEASIVTDFKSDRDLTLLEFTSQNTYQFPAKKDNNIIHTHSSALVGQEIYAVGYSAKTGEFVTQTGIIERIPQTPLQEGYQLGYSSNILSGMSGGAIFNNDGQLIGINGISSFPILNTAYVFEDNTKPSSAEIEQLRKLSWGIPIRNLLTQLNPQVIARYDLPFPETKTDIKNSQLIGWLGELETKAKQITVRIDNTQNSKDNGSGVIIAKEENTYTVLTANHVICSQKDLGTGECVGDYKLLAPDGEEYVLDNSTFQGQEGVDLATLTFTSDRNYQVAELADYSLQDDDAVFVAGYPNFSQKPQKANLLFSLGYGLSQEVGFGDLYDTDLTTDNLASSRVSVSGGYGLVYTSITYGGMSGGAVLDKDGRVIGIHGLAEGEEDKKLLVGYSLGVPIATFLGLSERLGIDSDRLQLQNNRPTQLSQQKKDTFEAAILNVEISQGNAKPIQLLERASHFLKLRRYREALEPIDRAISIIQQQSKQEDLYLALLGKGLIYWYLGEYQAALENINLSIAANPDFATTFQHKAWILMDLEQYEKALNTIQKAIALQQQNANYYALEGQILLGLEQYSAAETAYNQAIELSPRADLYNSRGLIYFEQQEWEKAETDYNQAIRANPKYFLAFVNRGYLYDEQGKQELGIADYTEAIKINPQFALAYSNRGKIYNDRQEWQLALTDYNQAIALNPDLALTYVNRGYLYQQHQQWDKALVDYDRAISLNVPESAFAYLNRGAIYVDRQQWNKALADSNQAIAIASELDLPPSYRSHIALAYNNRGTSYLGLQQWDKALIDFKRAIELNPNLALAYFNLGGIYHRQEKYTNALSEYNQALSLAHNFLYAPYAIHNIGLIQYEMGDINKARQQFQQAIEINSQLSEPKFALAVVLFSQGAKNEGLQLAETALKLDKQYANIEFLEKNLWGKQLISDAEQLLSNPKVQEFAAQF